LSDAKDNDVLMYFVQSPNSDPIKAESTSWLDDADKTMLKGFVPGRYFEAEHFSFSLKLGDDEGGVGAALEDNRSFARWRGLTDTSVKPSPAFRAEPDDVSITRMIDASSPILLQYCLESKPFDTVVMVKRARKGTEGKLAVVLRMEFKRVWIRSIDWDDGDTVSESCKFKFTSVDITYAKYTPNGDPDSTLNCSWRAK
jgi:type VI protein secretion system component Hcp